MAFVFGTLINNDNSNYVTTAHPLAIPAILSELSLPYPTNRWWNNLFLGNNRVCPDPYQVQPVTQGLYICYPARTVSATAITTAFLQNMAITASETIVSRKIPSYTDMGVGYRWQVDSTHKMLAYLVEGMAYVTMEFTALTPLITTQHAILSVNGGTTPGAVTATKFKVVLNNGQTWIIYTSSSITLTWSNTGGWQLLASAAFTGTLQVVYLKDATYETALDTSANTYARGGSVSATITGNIETLTFTWDKQGAGALLHFAYPHHMDILQSPTTTSLSYQALKGNMTGILGSSWTLQDNLPTISWDAANPIPAQNIADIDTALAAEPIVTPTSTSTYTFGKLINQLASLALIAHVRSNFSLRNTLVTTIESAFNAWLDGTSSNAMRYDTTWGGLVSVDALVDSSHQFGQGWYNDSHFHFGYWIRVAAILARFDATWKSTYQGIVTQFVRDIMNPSSGDAKFTRFRHFDFFAGHSWAAGLFDFGDSRNQESTTEAVNAWYGCYLWGLAINDENIQGHARILLAGELRGAIKYWHIKSADTIYDAVFAANKVVGIHWSSKVDYATFFGNLPEYIFGIQVGYPVTPITELLLDSAWVTEAYAKLNSLLSTRTSATRVTLLNGGSGYASGTQNNVTVSVGGATMNIEITGGVVTTIYGLVLRGSGYTDGQVVTLNAPGGGTGAQVTIYTSAEQGWLNSVYALQAVIDNASAYTNIKNQTGFDEGNSRTNLLYWAATRNAGGTTTSTSTTTTSTSTTTTSTSSSTTTTLTSTSTSSSTTTTLTSTSTSMTTTLTGTTTSTSTTIDLVFSIGM